MQLSKTLWVVLTVACTVIILVSNIVNLRDSSAAALADASRNYSLPRKLAINSTETEPVAPATPPLLAFVGVFTALKPERRQALRQTWFPSSPEELQRLEADTKIRLRFVVGSIEDADSQSILKEEQQVHQDFQILQVKETYENLVLKVYTFLKDVQAKYDPEYIIKTDDDLYIRPDRLTQVIPQWQARNSGYVGVMRAGTDAHDMTYSPWYEPLGVLHNKKYYMYASGGMYGLSRTAVKLLTSVPMEDRRLSGGGDDTSIGLWVMGYNIPYFDDRRLGVYYETGECPDNFVVLTGGCNGLCDAATLVPQLHQDPKCTQADSAELPMLDEWYDYSAVGCIKMVDGNVNKTACLEEPSQ